MSKRSFTLIIVVLSLMLSTVAYAQEPPVLVLTEKQINEEFTIPSTTTRTISGLEVDVHEEGVYISFDMTVTRDGTSNTLSIIAVLIGLRVNEVVLENTMVSSFQATRSQRTAVAGLVEQAWGDYVTSVFGELPTDLVASEGFIMRDGGICDPIRHMGC
jgi:hypothetical protein